MYKFKLDFWAIGCPSLRLLGDRKFQSKFKKVAKIAEISIKDASLSFSATVGKMLEASQ
ncbi:hypothetical protein H6F71_10115 [Microcoleus sp. FACHB-61]|nr:hypothetical protein [Microcoleus sp. FACHB-61]